MSIIHRSILGALALLFLLASPAAAIPTCGLGVGWLATCTAGTTLYDARGDVAMINVLDSSDFLARDQFTGTATVTIGTPNMPPPGDSHNVTIPFYFYADLRSPDSTMRFEVTTPPYGAALEQIYSDQTSMASEGLIRFTHPTFGVLTSVQSFEMLGHFSFPFTPQAEPTLNPDAYFTAGDQTYRTIGFTFFSLSNPRDPVVFPPPPPPIARVPEPSTLLLAGLGAVAGVLALRRR